MVLEGQASVLRSQREFGSAGETGVVALAMGSKGQVRPSDGV